MVFTIERLREIWGAVAGGEGERGSFLVAFGLAFIRADPENVLMLLDAATRLVQKYELSEYGQIPYAGARDGDKTASAQARARGVDAAPED